MAGTEQEKSEKINKLRPKIPKEFYEKSDAWGFRSCLRLLGLPLLWIILLPYLYKILPLLAFTATVPLGIAISKTTLLVHEAVHGTLFKTPVYNRIAGCIGGWWTVVDFFAFEVLHKQHHAHVGVENDPQLLDYGALENATRLKLTWHLLRPLLGWNVKHMLTLVQQRLAMSRSWQTSVVELVGLLTVQGSFFLIATDGGKYVWLGLIFPIAAATVGLFMSQIRGFCEHVPLQGEEAAMRLRSHISNPIERPFLHYMNYNFHGEHHKYPRIPSRNLPAFAEWLKEQGVTIERSSSYLTTIYLRWQACGELGRMR